MTTVEVHREVDRFVLYFETPKHEVSAYALASALVGLADAVREANNLVNPGHVVEVVVESLSDGSFKATVRTVYTKAKNLFSHTAVQAVIYGVISTYVYEKGLKSEVPPQIIVTGDLVTVVIGNDRIIVPKDVYEAKRQLEKSIRFKSAVGQIFDAASSDVSITGLAITEDDGGKRPPLMVNREQFAIFEVSRDVDEHIREIVEITHVEINRAILERGKRRWEFFWRGIRIAAPILDDGFYDRFFAHEITIAPGDSLHVALRIIQEKSRDTGIYVNARYEIVEVYEHLPRLKQTGF